MPRNPPASKAVDPIIRYSHADWAEAAMMASVMKGQRAALWPAVAVVVVLAATCYPHVPRWELALMVVVSMVVTVVRLRFVQGYERLAKTDRIDVQLSYLHRYRGFWVLNGVAPEGGEVEAAGAVGSDDGAVEERDFGGGVDAVRRRRVPVADVRHAPR